MQVAHESSKDPPAASSKELITVSLQQIFLILLLFSPFTIQGQEPNQSPFGIAWRVSGPWHAQGKEGLVSTGDAVEPGSLLEPVEGTHAHSITVLLPDGQRILYECFAPEDCKRGFRVPSLYRKPQPMAVDLLARVNYEMLNRRNDHGRVTSQGEPRIPRDEAVSVLASGNTVEIAGLASALSNGSYWYEIRLLSGESSFQSRHGFQKTSKSIQLTLPSEGLFEVLIADQLNTPRIDLLVAAVLEPRAQSLLKDFQNIQALLKDWNEDYQGWPIHDFQRAYLQTNSPGMDFPTLRGTGATVKDKTRNNEITSEPKFTPSPGVFSADTEVSLRCDTPGGSIHFTVDGSQPTVASTLYHAPVVVKGTALTIKAFASSKGKRDSPVVTGIFRIGD